LQAAAAWPSEFLYPRPLSADTINVAVQPVSVDQYGNDSTSTTTKNGDNQDSPNQDFRTSQFTQAPPPTETGGSIPITPPLPGGTILPPAPPITPITPILPVPPLPPVVPPPTDSIFNELNTLPTGTATFVQSLYQTVTDTVTTVLPKNLPTTTASTRKKVVSTRSKAVVRSAGTMKSSSQATQRITTQLQAPVVQNQTMFGGGMGSPGGVAGVGSAGSAGGVGGTGVSAGGVGSSGGIGGVGSIGGVGGVGGVGGIGGIGGIGGVHANRVSIEAIVPTRGLIGFETDLVNLTRGEGLMSHLFAEYAPFKGEIEGRNRGVMVSMENGTSTAYALNTTQDRGRLFIGPQEDVYAGMIVGENARPEDLPVNPCRAKRLTNMRSQGDGKGVQLEAPLRMSLERAIEYIDVDEYVEATPKSMRLRKRILDATTRKRSAAAVA